MADISRVELPNGDVHWFKDEYARSLRYELLRGIGENNILPFHWKDGRGVIPYNISIIKTEWNRPLCAIITNPYKNIRSCSGGYSGYADDVIFRNTNKVTIPAHGCASLYFDLIAPPFNDGNVYFQNYYGWPSDRSYYHDCEYHLENMRCWSNLPLDYITSSGDDLARIVVINNSNSSITVYPNDVSMKCNITVCTNFNRVYNWYEYISNDTVVFNMDQYEWWNRFELNSYEDYDHLYVNVFFEGANQGDNRAVSLYRAPVNDPNNWTLVGTISNSAKIKWTFGTDLYYYKIRCSINNSDQVKDYLCSYIGTAIIEGV